MRYSKIHFRLLAAACSLLAVPAMAQDDEMSFTGPYVSVFAGYSFAHDGDNDRIVFDRDNNGTFEDTVVTSGGADAFSPGFCSGTFVTNAPGGGCGKDRNRIEYGARVGYDARIGSGAVLGALLEISKADATDGTSAFSITPAAYEINRKLDYAVSARARLGFTPSSRMLIYGTGGASYARIKHDFSTTNTANAFTEYNDRKMVWGWQAGAGLEYMLTPNISLGAEYLHSQYNDKKYYVAVTQGTAAATNPFLLAGGQTNLRTSRQKFTLDTVRAVLSFRFGARSAIVETEPAMAPPPPPPPPPPPSPPPPPVVQCNKGPYIVFFDWDKSDITAEASSILDSAVSAYGSCARVPVMVAGYADRSGSPGYNQGLSERRAANVRGYLSSHGVEDGAITTQGFGEENNRVPTADGVRELQNRRVEITYGPGSGM